MMPTYENLELCLHTDKRHAVNTKNSEALYSVRYRRPGAQMKTLRTAMVSSEQVWIIVDCTSGKGDTIC